MPRVAVLLLLLTLPSIAQRPAPVVSPELLADNRVTFRLGAPTAVDVQLSGDWMGPRPPVPLTKDDAGIWSVTVGPFEPNVYSYRFLVEGVAAPDPSCRCTFASAGRFASSRFTIPGTPPQPWEAQSVPKGVLHSEAYFSRRQNKNRSLLVYTPPGYDGRKRFPLLVLLPGTPGDEYDWTLGGGDAHHVFDNLIASGKMRPMVVVMHPSDVLPTGTRALHLKEFEPLLVDEVLPAVKQRYRLENAPEHWAIAGLSLGGEFAATTGLRHPELFRTVASISGSIVERDFEDRFGTFLKEPARAKDYKLIWFGCGDADIFAGGTKALMARFEAAGIAVTYRTFNGAHSMPVFRKELVELLPKLFR